MCAPPLDCWPAHPVPQPSLTPVSTAGAKRRVRSRAAARGVFSLPLGQAARTMCAVCALIRLERPVRPYVMCALALEGPERLA